MERLPEIAEKLDPPSQREYLESVDGGNILLHLIAKNIDLSLNEGERASVRATELFPEARNFFFESLYFSFLAGRLTVLHQGLELLNQRSPAHLFTSQVRTKNAIRAHTYTICMEGTRPHDGFHHSSQLSSFSIHSSGFPTRKNDKKLCQKVQQKNRGG
jgi:hypothetical protein